MTTTCVFPNPFLRFLVFLNIHNDSIDMKLTFCQISCKSNNRNVDFEGSPRTFGTDLVYHCTEEKIDNVLTHYGIAVVERFKNIDAIIMKAGVPQTSRSRHYDQHMCERGKAKPDCVHSTLRFLPMIMT